MLTSETLNRLVAQARANAIQPVNGVYEFHLTPAEADRLRAMLPRGWRLKNPAQALKEMRRPDGIIDIERE